VSSEQEQLNRAKGLDLIALGEIYDAYSPEIFKHAMKILGNELLAEDCVSETFARFLQALNAGKGPREFLRAYLYRIAHNWMADYFRKQPEKIEILHESFSDKNEISPEGHIEMEFEKRSVRYALANLTQNQREVITLRYLEGWSTEEIARVTRKPVGAVKALQHRGLNAMRRCLQRFEQESKP
jgi:RNA polymerase sigma-70 factor (ECF subfamily)